MTELSYLLLRVVSGLLFFQVGSVKFLGWFGGMPTGTEMTTQIRIGGMLEFFGGLAIMLGLFTRPVAFILSGEMAVILALPDIVERLVNQGLEPLVSNPDQFAALLKSDMAKFAKIIQDANIKVEN